MGVAVLMFRRVSAVCGYAELGGHTGPKQLTSLILISLWLVYIIMSSLHAYDHINIEF